MDLTSQTFSNVLGLSQTPVAASKTNPSYSLSFFDRQTKNSQGLFTEDERSLFAEDFNDSGYASNSFSLSTPKQPILTPLDSSTENPFFVQKTGDQESAEFSDTLWPTENDPLRPWFHFSSPGRSISGDLPHRFIHDSPLSALMVEARGLDAPLMETLFIEGLGLGDLGLRPEKFFENLRRLRVGED